MRGAIPTRASLNDLGVDDKDSGLPTLSTSVELSSITQTGLRNRFNNRGSQFPDWQTEAQSFEEVIDEAPLLAEEAVIGGPAISSVELAGAISSGVAAAVGFGIVGVAAAVAGLVVWIVNEQEANQAADLQTQKMNKLLNLPIWLFVRMKNDPSGAQTWWRGTVRNISWGPRATVVVVRVTVGKGRETTVTSIHLANQWRAELGDPPSLRKRTYMYDQETKQLQAGTITNRHWDMYDNLIRSLPPSEPCRFKVGDGVLSGKNYTVLRVTHAGGKWKADIGGRTVLIEDLLPAETETFELGDKVTVTNDDDGKIFTVVGISLGKVEVVDEEGLHSVFNNYELSGQIIEMPTDTWIFRCVPDMESARLTTDYRVYKNSSYY